MFVKGFEKTAGIFDKLKTFFKAPVAKATSAQVARGSTAPKVLGYRIDKTPITTQSGLNMARKSGSVRYSDIA